MAAKNTPVMEQHARAKRAYPDAVVFFRLGDFYEMFGDDAVLCSRLLNLTLTSREKGKPNEVPMAGVPHHAAHNYIGRLLALGHRVALCEQMADPKLCKGIVPREVVRVLTPGLITQDEHLIAGENNWLAALHVGATHTGLALLDISTGELRSARVSDLAAALGELAHASAREVLVACGEGVVADAELLTTVEAALGKSAVHEDRPLDVQDVATVLGSLEGEALLLDLEQRLAVARVLRFARECTPGVELPVRAIAHFSLNDAMVIDANAQRHLELTTSNSGDSKATLLACIDLTQSPMGARLLRRRLLAPLMTLESIERRHDEVECMVQHAVVRARLRTALSEVGDLERLVARVILGEASPKDLGAIRDGLLAATRAVEALEQLPPKTRAVHGPGGEGPLTDGLARVRDRLVGALVERPPALNKEGAVFSEGFDPELTRLETVRRDGADLIVRLESRLREETNIQSLKARYTRVFGWYLEVSKAALNKVPKAWRRKQTVAGGERFTLDDLDDLATQIASAEENHRARERELLRELLLSVAGEADAIAKLGQELAILDVASSLAELAQRHDYVRPRMDNGGVLEVQEGRHPVVERLAAGAAQTRFVPNDVSLDLSGGRLWVITGPNMAGKSTFLRQVALITILAQIGSFVPAKSARIGLVDRVLSRVGASDDLARGQSTFMVEMRETADILRHATPRSLVILDEIGRGTSTFDGLAIAWAVTEHLDTVCRCRALFATHYHELTALDEQSPQIVNYSVSAREQDGEVVFLHRVVPGPVSQSYGVAVAKLAGLPASVLRRAAELLAAFEGAPAEGEVPKGKARRARNVGQLDLFARGQQRSEAPPVATLVPVAEGEVLQTLRSLDPNRLAPLDALQLVIALKAKL
jgi:DNA mismatch repair protein MutS